MRYFWNLLKNLDKVLVILPVCFAAISLTMICSIGYEDHFTFTRDMKVQLLAYVIGALVLCVVLFFDYQRFQGIERILYIGSILLLLSVYLPVIGSTQMGARSWLSLGPINLQPAELVKISFILMFANYLCNHRDNLQSLKGLLLAVLYSLPFVLLILIEPDLGNVLVFAVIFILMVFFAGIDYKLFAKCGVAALIAMPIAYFFMEPHQRSRILAFLNPTDMSIKANYQVWQSKVAIGSGGFLGKGLFHGTQKELKFLPVQKSDFIFAVIVEELGMIGGAVVIALYSIFIYRLCKIASNAKDLYGALIVIGILAMFAFQIFQNIGMTMGIMPVTGITLPFISYGGTSIVTNMIALGLVLNVGIRSKLINF